MAKEEIRTTESGRIIESLTTLLTANDNVQLALLFGSFAQGRASAGSDIDIGIAYSGRISTDELVRLGQQISRVTGHEADVVDLRAAHGTLLEQILAHRKTLLRRDPELLGALISRRIVEEWDLMPLIDMVLRKRRERFIDGNKSHKPKA
jgi:predicted nucleotidyltransferase